MQNAMTFEQFLRRPDVTYEELARFDPAQQGDPPPVAEQVEIQVKYQGYIDRQLEQVERAVKMESTRIPDGFDYLAAPGPDRRSPGKADQIPSRYPGAGVTHSGDDPGGHHRHFHCSQGTGAGMTGGAVKILESGAAGAGDCAHPGAG